MFAIPEPSPADVQEGFAHWRRERTHQSNPMPPARRAQLVQLLAHYRIIEGPCQSRQI